MRENCSAVGEDSTSQRSQALRVSRGGLQALRHAPVLITLQRE